MEVAIHRIDHADEAGLLAYVRIRNAVTPDNTDSVEQIRWENATYPGEVVRFIETDRSKMVRLDLAGLIPPEVRVPAGIRLVTLAERPDLLPGVHAVAIEAFPDIPSTDEPIDVGTLEAFTERDVDRTGSRRTRSSSRSTRPRARSRATRTSSTRRAARPSPTTT